MMPALQLRLIGAGILALLIGFGLWYLHHDGYETGKTEVLVAWDADKLKQAEAQRQALVAYAEKLKQAEEQHDQDQAVIGDLADRARRVRVTFMPACGSAGAGFDPDGKAGVFSNRVDRLFAEFQQRVGGLIARCDQLNIDAIRLSASRQ